MLVPTNEPVSIKKWNKQVSHRLFTDEINNSSKTACISRNVFANWFTWPTSPLPVTVLLITFFCQRSIFPKKKKNCKQIYKFFAGDLGMIPGLGRSPGGRHGNPLQYSCLGNSWTEEPGGLQSMGSWRIGHDWATSLSLFSFMHWSRKWQPSPVFLPGEFQGQGSLVGFHLWGRTESTRLKRLSSSSSSSRVTKHSTYKFLIGTKLEKPQDFKGKLWGGSSHYWIWWLWDEGANFISLNAQERGSQW